jgi:protein-L-isoaspartate O-methyltransferase
LNLNLNSDCLSYDRIYVGVGVTEEQEQLIKSLVKINGIIVMPLNDNVSNLNYIETNCESVSIFLFFCFTKLIKLKRISETDYEMASLMTVSFASLVTDNFENNPSFNLRNF